MTVEDLEHFRNLLLEREATVGGWLGHPESAHEGDIRRTRELLEQIREAIHRIDRHEYGVCADCGEEVEAFRLEIQPVTQVCLGCISAEERSRLEDDLLLASKIHRALLPQTAANIPGFTLGVQSAAAQFVGGDYYDFLTSANGASLVVIADCMGKGVSAGLLLSNVQGAIRVLAETVGSPAQLVARLNRWLCRNVPVTKFVSLACVAVYPSENGSARLVYANAGHCPPLVVRKDGSTTALGPTGAVLGIQEGFEYTQEEVRMATGDLLVLYTDGVLEASNEGGEMFGEARLCDLVLGNRTEEAKGLVAAVVAGVLRFCQRQEWEDDYTVIALRKG